VKTVARTQNPLSSRVHSNIAWQNQPLKSHSVEWHSSEWRSYNPPLAMCLQWNCLLCNSIDYGTISFQQS